MNHRALRLLWVGPLVSASLLAAAGCDESVGTGSTGSGGGGGASSKTVSVDVTASERTYVDLDTAAVVDEKADWDVAFQGLDVYTHGGISGVGKGAAFGPLDPSAIQSNSTPTVPFLITDDTNGAFMSWYAYDDISHQLFSRYHVIGVQRDQRFFKVQVLAYYGVVQGAPVAALYKVRYAEVTSTGIGATMTIDALDGTAGGTTPTDDKPSGCLDLTTGDTPMLTPAQASASVDWDLCFRRSMISVNGEAGGPGATKAVDLEAEATASETDTEVEGRTETTELPLFDGVDFATLNDPALAYRGDHVVTAFSDRWIDKTANPLAPTDAAWLVVGSEGTNRFVIAFDGFEGASADAPGKVTMRLHAVQ